MAVASESIVVEGTPVFVEGEGEHAILMVHGWPDRHHLWDGQVEHLLAEFPGELRCVRFTLPGFDLSQPPRPRSFQQLADFLGLVTDRVSPGRPVTLLLHDWGCVFGYRFAAQQPQRVARIVGVDVGDYHGPALRRSLSLAAGLMIAGYQLWLVLAWKVGRHLDGRLGDRMTQWMARVAGSRVPPGKIGWQLNYPYVVQWTGAFGGAGGAPPVAPACPMLYCWGRRKPFQFQSTEWVQWLARQPGCVVRPFETGHWVMLQQAGLFNSALVAWLRSTPV